VTNAKKAIHRQPAIVTPVTDSCPVRQECGVVELHRVAIPVSVNVRRVGPAPRMFRYRLATQTRARSNDEVKRVAPNDRISGGARWHGRRRDVDDVCCINRQWGTRIRNGTCRPRSGWSPGVVTPSHHQKQSDDNRTLPSMHAVWCENVRQTRIGQAPSGLNWNPTPQPRRHQVYARRKGARLDVRPDRTRT
jgi:hypothetical protein